DSALANGVGTFSVLFAAAGTQSLTVSDTVNSNIAGQINALVRAGATAQFSLSGLASAVTAGQGGTVTITARDAFGNLTAGYAGTVHFASSDGQAALPADSRLTNGTGTFHVALKTAGTQTLTA